MHSQEHERETTVSANDGSVVQKNREFWDHWYRFLFHMTSFFPVVAILGMGAILDVKTEALLIFSIFAAATIALEICFSVVRMVQTRIHVIENDLRRANSDDDSERWIGLNVAHKDASLESAKYIVWTGVTAMSWLMVAAFQLRYLANQPMREELFLIAGFCAGFNVMLAIRKMWVATKFPMHPLEFAPAIVSQEGIPVEASGSEGHVG